MPRGKPFAGVKTLFFRFLRETIRAIFDVAIFLFKGFRLTFPPRPLLESFLPLFEGVERFL